MAVGCMCRPTGFCLHLDAFAFGTPPSASSRSLLCCAELCLTARGSSHQDARTEVLRLLLLGTLDVNRHCARLLVQKLLTFCLTVAVGVGKPWVIQPPGALMVLINSFALQQCIIDAGATPPEVPHHPSRVWQLWRTTQRSAKRAEVARRDGRQQPTTGPVMRTTASDVALHGRHLNEVSASTVGEFTAAVGNSAVDKILLGAGTYELTSDMCTGSAVCIDRALTIEAEVPGAVVLNAMGARRVFFIQLWRDGRADWVEHYRRICFCAECSPFEPSATFPPVSRESNPCVTFHRPTGLLTVAICVCVAGGELSHESNPHV